MIELIKKPAYFFFSFIILFSCTKEEKIEGVACDGSNLSYNTGISAIINSNCTTSNCHGSGSSNGDFTSFSGLQGVISNGAFNKEVIVDQSMPRGSKRLTESQLNNIKCWIDNGYPEN